MSEWGHVYVVRCQDLYKIGYTNGSVSQRVAMFQVGNPYQVKLMCAIPALDPIKLEREIHETYRSKHVRGEWYRLTKVNVRSLVNTERIAKAEQIKWQLRRGYEIAGWLEEMDNART